MWHSNKETILITSELSQILSARGYQGTYGLLLTSHFRGMSILACESEVKLLLKKDIVNYRKR